MKLGRILWRMWLTAISVRFKDHGLMEKKKNQLLKKKSHPWIIFKSLQSFFHEQYEITSEHKHSQ